MILLPLLLLLAACNNDPNTKRDFNGFLPIHHAVQDGDLARAEDLLKKSGQANAPDLDGVYPLHRAARQGDIEMAKLLLKYKANINAPTRDGWTPLHIATWYKQPKIAELLMAEGASPSLKTPDGSTPLHMACQKGEHEIIDTLMKDWPANLASGKPDVDAPDGKGRAPLILAVQSADMQSITKLLLLGASAQCADADGNTPLHLLVGNDKRFMANDQQVLAEDLLNRGAQVNAVNAAGKTPYALALEQNDTRLAQLFASRGGH